MGKISPEVYQHMVDVNGEEWTRNFIASSGDEPPDGYEAPAPTSPEVPGAEAPPAPDEEGGLSVGELQRDLIQQQAQLAARRKERFDAAAAELAKQRSGPPLSERLFQLSAAFASPTQTPGFGGVMANIMPLLARQGAEVREGRTLDKEKLRLLREKYEDADAKGEEDTLARRIELAKIADAQRKSKQTTYGFNPVTGAVQGLPKQVHQPQTPEDFAKIPRGDYFMVPAGPQKGRIIPKV